MLLSCLTLKRLRILSTCGLLLTGMLHHAGAQTNVLSTSHLAELVMTGNYSAADFSTQAPPVDPADLARQIESGISSDSLKSYILRLASFKNRNSGSDTLSASVGIGAARRWAYEKFQSFSQQNGGRLLPSYLQFEQDICGINAHSNVLAVLPGLIPESGLILVEGHMDSRCAVLCDTACLAEGVEDNATGAALVLEMARVLSKWRFNNTIVFMITTAEEQGLLGAYAFANYAKTKNLNLRAVLNNDVIGGIICGKTSSPPSCPGMNNIDSTSVRLFSQGGFNSPHKQLSRYIKLQYKENLLPTTSVPMNVRIMSPEDRTGRSGDHIPFRENGFTAMRFTAANEHGNASNNLNYTDRQHSSRDILGVDTDQNGDVDSFYVDFHYLARNTVINAVGAGSAARNVPAPPDFFAGQNGNQLTLVFDETFPPTTLRLAVRSTLNDWDTVYQFTAHGPGTVSGFTCSVNSPQYVSLATVDGSGMESLFSGEKIAITAATHEGEIPENNVQLFQNKPNPFDEATWISFSIADLPKGLRTAAVQICDNQGKIVETIPVEQLKAGYNEVLYTHGYGMQGLFTYSLLLNGKAVASRQMVFAN